MKIASEMNTTNTCHNCGNNVAANADKCTVCGTILIVVAQIQVPEQEGNRVIVLDNLSLDNIAQRQSIKHKIRLSKTPIPIEEASKPVEKAIIPEKKEENLSKQEVSPILVEEKEIILPVLEEKTVIQPIIKENKPIVVPQQEVISPSIEVNPFDIANLIKEMDKKDKELSNFLEGENVEKTIVEPKEIVPPPVVEKEIYSVSDALKEIMKEEEKLKAFLAEKPVEKLNPLDDLPVYTEKQKAVPLSELIIFPEKEKKIEPPIIPEEKTEILKPVMEEEESPVLGIEKVPHSVPDKIGKPAIAWLIRHTENRKPVYYEIFEGENTIGRGDKVTPIEVDISDDKYVSRGHAWIRAFKVVGNVFVFELRDDGAKRKDRTPSMNGTYLNASMRRIEPDVTMYLQDGDTIQVGMTKLVFKIKPQGNKNAHQVFEDVLKSDYTITVIF